MRLVPADFDVAGDERGVGVHGDSIDFAFCNLRGGRSGFLGLLRFAAGP